MQSIEATGKKFDLTKYLEAREKCIGAVDKVLSSLYLGMTEKDGHQLIEESLKELGSKKRWHPNKFRIEKDTQRSFKEQSLENSKLKEDDMVFVDIGPVFGDQEADYGKTIVFKPTQDSTDKVELAKASEKIFNELQMIWANDNITGEKLYEIADSLAKEKGYELNHSMAGHRLGDFPHALISRDKLSEFEHCPVEQLWVLEVHLRDVKTECGSFFEDILTKVK